MFKKNLIGLYYKEEIVNLIPWVSILNNPPSSSLQGIFCFLKFFSSLYCKLISISNELLEIIIIYILSLY